MNIWSIVIAAAIFILPSLLSGKKTAGKKTVSVPRDAEEPEVPRTFADLEDDDEAEYATDGLGQPVFTYEDNSGVSAVATSGRETQTRVVLQSTLGDNIPVTVSGELFDLRKAVIYQAIMERVGE